MMKCFKVWYFPWCTMVLVIMPHLIYLCVRLSRSRFRTPQKYKEKNSKVGNFALRNSYVKCVLKLNWRGWRGSYLSLLQLQSSLELSGALQSVLCSLFISFEHSLLIFDCHLVLLSHLAHIAHCHVALSSLPSVCVGPFFIAFSVSYSTLALSSLPSVCFGPFSIAFSVSYPQ